MTFNEEDNVKENEVLEEQPEEIVVEEEVVEQEKEEKTVKVNDKKVKKAGKVKATVSELKKVTWPTFGKVVKSTVVVLSVTAVFLLVVLGIDQLLYFLYGLLTKNM